jgi:general secretion pathway protein B
MSYILDALRKADAQRERDPARGIHAQPFAAAGARAPVRNAKAWLWLGIACLGLALVGATWWFSRPAVPGVVLAPGAAAPAMPALPAPAAMAPAPAPATAVPGTAVAERPATPDGAQMPARNAFRPPAGTVMPPAPTSVAPMATPAPAGPAQKAQRPPLPPPAATARATGPAGVAAPSSTPIAAAPASAPVPATAVPPAPAASGRVLTQAELPPEIQRELPKLVISGGVYSQNPAQRMLIVNGQVINEGAEPAAGVVLEQIRARTAVWRFRGYRYAVTY